MSSQSALSKSEVEKLLRHGAYDIFNEEKSGSGDAESNAFVQQDIDTILERRSRTIVHENTGSQSNAGGGTFSKASFKVAKSPGAAGASAVEDDIDVEDPEFWKKMLGEPKVDEVVQLDKASRRRVPTNYNENLMLQQLDRRISLGDGDQPSSDSFEEEEESGAEDDTFERSRWGGKAVKNEWAKDDAEALVRAQCRFGYGLVPWEQFLKHLSLPEYTSSHEVRRTRVFF